MPPAAHVQLSGIAARRQHGGGFRAAGTTSFTPAPATSSWTAWETSDALGISEWEDILELLGLLGLLIRVRYYFVLRRYFISPLPFSIFFEFPSKAISTFLKFSLILSGLIFSKLLEDRTLDNLSARQLVSLFSIFTNISVEDDLRDGCPKAEDDAVQKMATMLTNLYTEYKDKEHQYRINTGFDYNVQFDLLNYVGEWCDCNDMESCKFLLQNLGAEKEVFIGEFVKALLKINNISSEMEKLAELTGNMALLAKLKEIPNLTLKYVVTNQSLYV